MGDPPGFRSKSRGDCGRVFFIVQCPARTSREAGMGADTKRHLFKMKRGASQKRVISIVGATIIFATFLVNDAKRNHLKELADSIEAAENTFIIHADNRRN